MTRRLDIELEFTADPERRRRQVDGSPTTLVDQVLPAGEHAVTWNGTTSAGQPVASGTYSMRSESGSFLNVRPMTLLR